MDDGIITGDETLMIRTINDIKSVFNLKVQDGMKDFLGCKIEIKAENGWIKQTRIVDRLEKDWKHEIKKREFNIPVGEGYKVIRPNEEEKLMDEEEQQLFRSGIVTLMYLVKLGQP